jgi:recombination protein RecR
MSEAPLRRLIQLIAKLPGLGPRSARRVVIHLLQQRNELMEPLSKELGDVAAKIVDCDVCGNLDVTSPCHLCADPTREPGVLCVVEDVADLWALERNAAYKGQFHILGGTLSAINGIGPEDLRIPALIQRVEGGAIQEVILALNATIDGQTTAHYVADQLERFPLKVTALAHGVPVGGELDYLDDGTITTALQSRRVL